MGGEAADAADDRLVVAKGAIAVQLDEVLDEPADVVERERTQRMARQQHLLPGRQLGEDLALQLPRLALEAADLELELRPTELLELGDLVLELDDRALEVERLTSVDHGRHRSVYSTPELVGTGEAAHPRLLAEPGALPSRIAARRAEDGVGQGAGGERAIEQLGDLGVADRRQAGHLGPPLFADAARLVDQAAGEHDVDARGDARLEPLPRRIEQQHRDRMARRRQRTMMARVMLGDGHAGERVHLERTHQAHQIGGGDALGRARIDGAQA